MSFLRICIIIAEVFLCAAAVIAGSKDNWLGLGLILAFSVVLGYVNFREGRK